VRRACALATVLLTLSGTAIIYIINRTLRHVMTAPRKLHITKILNDDDFSELDVEKSEGFLLHLQDFLVTIGVAKVEVGAYELEGKAYDMHTYYALLWEDPKAERGDRRRRITEFEDGQTLRYANKHIRLLIIFLANRIKIIFYAPTAHRAKIMKALLRFCSVMKVRAH
jgi:hypothetical protein